MDKIRGLVVATLLAVWCFPAVSSAKALPAEPAPPPALVTPARTAAAASRGANANATGLATREQQSRDLQDFKGGAVAIYIGSGALFVALIVLLILLI